MGVFIIIGIRIEINDSVERIILIFGIVMYGIKFFIMYWYIVMYFFIFMKKLFLVLEM